MPIRDTDRGWLELKREISAGGGFVAVGIMGAQAAQKHDGADGMTVAQVGTIHEYGATVTLKNGRTIVIPERSYIRATIDEHHETLSTTAAAAGRGILLGKFDRNYALALLGEKAVGLIKSRIADGIPPPNAPSTVRAKGSSTPLIDSGQLRSAITYQVHG